MSLFQYTDLLGYVTIFLFCLSHINWLTLNNNLYNTVKLHLLCVTINWERVWKKKIIHKTLMRPEQLKRNRTKLKKNKTKQNKTKQTNKQKKTTGLSDSKLFCSVTPRHWSWTIVLDICGIKSSLVNGWTYTQED